MTEEPEDILETMEKIREVNHPGVPADLVEEIVQIEYQTQEDRSTTQRKISETVESHLEEEE